MDAIERSPFLTGAATPRTGEDQILGYYSPTVGMWVVDTPECFRATSFSESRGL